MSELDFLQHPVLHDIIKGIKANKLLKDQAKFNLFTLSSYNAYLENFHSDVIISLLNTVGLHNEGDKFLKLFIDFLNNKYKVEINVEDFRKAYTYREIGDNLSHIDILIEGETESIIIENKINNAPDMENQIDRYYNFAVERNRTVTCIVYLSLDGIKLAPIPANEKASRITKSIGAFTNNNYDLVSGWLIPCLSNSTNEESRSLIYQYIKLIKHLANKNMDTSLLENLYQLISSAENLGKAKSILEFYNRIPEYRANKFISSIGNFLPFTQYVPYKPEFKIFQNYIDSETGYNFRLDFDFHDINNIIVRFYIPEKQNDAGIKAVSDKLKSIGLYDDFFNKGIAYFKKFTLNDPYTSLVEMDQSAIEFIQKMLQELRK